MTAALEYVLETEPGPRVTRLGVAGQAPWCGTSGASPVFTVVVDGKVVSGRTPGVRVLGSRTVDRGGGVVEEILRCAAPDGTAVELDWHVLRYADLAVIETWVGVRNVGERAVRVERLDSVALALATTESELLSFTSGWGKEFEPVRVPLTGNRLLQTLRGRSSQGEHPWFALIRVDGAVLCGSVVWSGNWVFRFEADPAGGHLLTGGLHDEGFAKVVGPGEQVDGPAVVLVLGDDGDLNTASTELARAARRHWAPRTALSDRLPVEWNHWWAYEDHSIDERVFSANVALAAGLGVEVCTLDAGWFGPADPASDWTQHRGDWDLVNHARFPNGLRALADDVHAKGMRFGMWCEIEALGAKATLADRRPEFPALRDGERLGYVCFGNPDAADWAFQTLDRLVRDHGADWIKLDFNLDPGLGCNRTDHGHGPDDGLFEHYTGYYRMLTRMREEHPEVVLENCSSGGLRIDLGMLRHTHLTFLSDPDWPEHGLQLLWGASTMLPPSQLLHWGYGEWFTEHRRQKLDPRDPNLRPHQIDYYRRIAMLGATGFSYGLPGLPAGFRDRLADGVRTYQRLVRPFVRSADLRRLTGQPERFGRGERWAAFQYSQPDRAEHLVLLFRLPGGEPTRPVRLRALEPDRTYEVEWVDAGRLERRTGEQLMGEGLLADLPEEGSELVTVRGR